MQVCTNSHIFEDSRLKQNNRTLMTLKGRRTASDLFPWCPNFGFCVSTPPLAPMPLYPNSHKFEESRLVFCKCPRMRLVWVSHATARIVIDVLVIFPPWCPYFGFLCLHLSTRRWVCTNSHNFEESRLGSFRGWELSEQYDTRHLGTSYFLPETTTSPMLCATNPKPDECLRRRGVDPRSILHIMPGSNFRYER